MRLACANKIPLCADSISDRELFASLLDKQRNINGVYAPVDVKASANGKQLILPCHLCEQSENRGGQEVLALKVAKGWSRRLKENISVERRNLIVARNINCYFLIQNNNVRVLLIKNINKNTAVFTCYMYT